MTTRRPSTAMSISELSNGKIHKVVATSVFRPVSTISMWGTRLRLLSGGAVCRRSFTLITLVAAPGVADDAAHKNNQSDEQWIHCVSFFQVQVGPLYVCGHRVDRGLQQHRT